MEELQQVYDIKLPPLEIELEKDVLGCILLDDKLIDDIVEVVKRETFYHEYHQEIWTAMLYLWHNNIGIGTTTLINRLQTKKSSDELIEYALQLTQPSTVNFENKVDLLVETYQKREVFNICLDIVNKDISGIASSNLVKLIENKVEKMGITSNIELEDFSEYVDDWLKDQEDETPIKQLRTGFKELDEKVMIEDGEFILIGARPAVGKSSFAVNIVKNFALQDINVLFISREMTHKQYMNKLMSLMTKVEHEKFKRKLKKTPAEWSSIMSAREKVKNFSVNFEHKKVTHIEQLEGLAKYLKKKDKLDVIVVDYLQLLETHQYRNQKQNQVSYISQKLKQIAKELEIPVIALTQLNRSSVTDGGNPREPHLADLRDSGKKLPVIPFPFIKGVHELFRGLTMKPNPEMVW